MHGALLAIRNPSPPTRTWTSVTQIRTPRIVGQRRSAAGRQGCARIPQPTHLLWRRLLVRERARVRLGGGVHSLSIPCVSVSSAKRVGGAKCVIANLHPYPPSGTTSLRGVAPVAASMMVGRPWLDGTPSPGTGTRGLGSIGAGVFGIWVLLLPPRPIVPPYKVRHHLCLFNPA